MCGQEYAEWLAGQEGDGEVSGTNEVTANLEILFAPSTNGHWELWAMSDLCHCSTLGISICIYLSSKYPICQARKTYQRLRSMSSMNHTSPL